MTSYETASLSLLAAILFYLFIRDFLLMLRRMFR